MLFFEYVFIQTAWELAMTTSHQIVLRIRNVYLGSASKNLNILTQKMVSDL
jgi:hypothetical protein